MFWWPWVGKPLIRRWVLDPNNEVFVIRKAKEKVVPTERLAGAKAQVQEKT